MTPYLSREGTVGGAPELVGQGFEDFSVLGELVEGRALLDGILVDQADVKVVADDVLTAGGGVGGELGDAQRAAPLEMGRKRGVSLGVFDGRCSIGHSTS
ncbi:hypothetical protein [Streptomyces sp. NBRC 110611]|uniref:hypothetical protein n=1 Tax=Streptomyces sp. NBRC 110611 TaxID=1621259 RepID=UPI0015EE461D|nr:hypothetical protein [Streptomyces sp. NBRC 110611]